MKVLYKLHGSFTAAGRELGAFKPPCGSFYRAVSRTKQSQEGLSISECQSVMELLPLKARLRVGAFQVPESR